MMTSSKIAIGGVAAFALAFAGASAPAMANDPPPAEAIASAHPALAGVDAVSDETVALLWKIAESPEVFAADGSGAVEVIVGDDVLRSTYGYEDSEIARLHDALADQHRTPSPSEASPTPASSLAVASGAAAAQAESGARVLYMDTQFLTAGAGAALYAAAQAGPVALTVAWTACTATFSGPIAIGAAILGGAFFADLAVKIVGAVVQNTGIAVYADWGIPPLRTVIE